MESLNSDERKRSTQKGLLFILARGRLRFLVRSSLAGAVILWIGLSGLFMIRGMFRGLSVANVAFMETGALVIVFPFASAIAWFQWKEFYKMASKDGLPGGEQNTMRGQDEGERS